MRLPAYAAATRFFRRARASRALPPTRRRATALTARPTLRGIPARFVPKVTALLPLDLPLEVVSPIIDDEVYWRRRALGRWSNCQVGEHGSSWKRLFFETHLQDFLEAFDVAKQSNEELMQLLALSKDYIFSLRVRQLLSHLDLATFFQAVPTLSNLDLTYGALHVGMSYVRTLFGMKPQDVTSLAKALRVTETLTVMSLRANQLDDSAVRTLGQHRARARRAARARGARARAHRPQRGDSVPRRAARPRRRAQPPA